MSDIFTQLRKLVYPPKWDSWQTLVWISIFSWAVSLLTTDRVQVLISSIGWLFLIPGIHWALNEESLFLGGNTKVNVRQNLTLGDPKEGFFLGPWITGALICIFLHGLLDLPLSVSVVLWPPISATIAALPRFIKLGPKFDLPKASIRQELIVLVLSNLVLSCWLQLYFSTQQWLRDYPSLMANDFSRSGFAVRLSPDKRPISRGVVLLEKAGEMLQENLAELTWPEVERRLSDLNQQMKSIKDSIMSQSSESLENPLWNLQGRTVPGREYAVQMYATWQGPTIDGRGYYLTQTCPIIRLPEVSPSPPAAASPFQRLQIKNPLARKSTETRQQRVKVTCGPIEGPMPGQPEIVTR